MIQPIDLTVQEKSNLADPVQHHPFDQLIEATVATVAESSSRLYKQTFRLWKQWCQDNHIDPLEVNAFNVRQFLIEQPVSKATREWQIAALRKLARLLALDYTNPARRAAYESLLLLRTPKEGITTNERQTRALSPAQADKVLRAWDGDKLIDKRNRALIAILFLAGLRRAEAVALRWSDIDLNEGVIHIRHGKGDTARDVALAGEYVLQVLETWKRAQETNREHVFCPVTKRDRLGQDSPISTQTLYKIVQITETRTGITFAPHDARRTFITEALATGTPLADIQAQAGHKRESTTLRYAKPVDARTRRLKLRLRYG